MKHLVSMNLKSCVAYPHKCSSILIFWKVDYIFIQSVPRPIIANNNVPQSKHFFWEPLHADTSVAHASIPLSKLEYQKTINN